MQLGCQEGARSLPVRVLLVEDDAALAAAMCAYLEDKGFAVDRAESLAAARAALPLAPWHAVLLDLHLPDGEGLSLIPAIRHRAPALPIIVLTARDQVSDRIRGLDAGADDYLVKPFEYPELAARVKALLRRALKATSDTLVLGPIGLDFSAQQAQLNGQPVELTTFEYRMLEYLVRERARVVSKQELSDYLYPHDEDRDSNVLEVLIGRLRRKLDPDGTLAPIETLRGRGYRFVLQAGQ